MKIKKFLYGKYFYNGLRISIGIALPVILSIFLNKKKIGLIISLGSICICVIDIPGLIKYQIKDMLICSFLCFFISFISSFLSFNFFISSIIIVIITFFLTLIISLGKNWIPISFSSMFIMIVNIHKHLFFKQSLLNSLLIFLGCIFFMFWSIVMDYLTLNVIKRQSISYGIFFMSDYLKAFCKFYNINYDINICYSNLIEIQMDIILSQNISRKILFNNFKNLKKNFSKQYDISLLNLLLYTFDLQDHIMSINIDNFMIRKVFKKTNMLCFISSLIKKVSNNLKNLGYSILEDKQYNLYTDTKMEFKAIQSEMLFLRKNMNFKRFSYAYLNLKILYKNILYISKLIKKISKKFFCQRNTQKPEILLDKTLDIFISNKKRNFFSCFSNLNIKSFDFIHSFRVTIAILTGYLFGIFLNFRDFFWIIITITVVLKNNYSLTRQRNFQRLVGTIIGCVITFLFMYFIKNKYILSFLIFFCLLMSYSFLTFNYMVSVVFTSLYVLLLSNILYTNYSFLIFERFIDTLIGCCLSMICIRIFPFWEYNFINKYINNLIYSIYDFIKITEQEIDDLKIKYINKLYKNNINKEDNNKKYNSKCFLSDKPVYILIDNYLLHREYAYFFLKINVYKNFLNLCQLFQRMILEPKYVRKFENEINKLIILFNLFISQIITIIILLKNNDSRYILGLPICKNIQKILIFLSSNLINIYTNKVINYNDINEFREIIFGLNNNFDKINNSVFISLDIKHEIRFIIIQCKFILISSFKILKNIKKIKL